MTILHIRICNGNFCTQTDRYPFDWRNPIGYFWAVALLSPMIFFEPIIILSDLFLAFGVCRFLTTFADDIKFEIKLFREQSEIKDDKIKLIEMFGNIVELHSTSKQLVRDKSNIFF